MSLKNSRWTMVIGAGIVFLILVALVWSSPAPTGASPMPQSTPGLDADMVDGHHAAASWAPASQRANKVLWAMSNGRINPAAFPIGWLDARFLNDNAGEVGNADVADGALSPSKISGTAWTSANDGAGSGLDADLLDGQQGFYYRNATNINTGFLSTAYYSAYNDLSSEGRIDCGASSDLCTRSQADARYWKLGGNAGTTPGTHFLGTTDNKALELRVNGSRALRLEPHAASPSLIGGHSGNSVTSGVMGATIGGGGAKGSTNRVTDDYGTVGGGRGNTAGGLWATVSGGHGNTASGDSSAVGGGSYNTAGPASSATVGGGVGNTAKNPGDTVGGGYHNDSIGFYATVGGGSGNTASGYYGTVGGGQSNDSIGYAATVSGGQGNDSIGYAATVGGGFDNLATGYAGVVPGGYRNSAGAQYSTVGGGYYNNASGSASIVPGGSNCTAQGNYSFAAGRRGKANHDGAFVWADSNNFDFASTAANQFSARTTGGARFVSAIDGSGNPTAGVELAAGGGSWSSLSDRSLKENFAPVDAEEVLARLAEVPIRTWNYKAQDPAIRHIGPVAQDFYAAFGLGEDDRRISTVDADGVALTAIQGLHKMLQDKDAQIACLEARVAKLEALVATLAKVEGTEETR